MRPLTPRQAAMLGAKCRYGLTHKEVAARFGTAPATIKNVMSVIYARLGVRGETQACFVLGQRDRDTVCADAAILRPEAV